MKNLISILGSTGSIGTQALEVINKHSDFFEVEVLTANNNSALLIEQAKKFKPNTVVITNEDKYKEVDDALFDLGIKVFAGTQSLEEVVEGENIDIVLTALVGYSGLKPTIRAIKAKKNIALANKERETPEYIQLDEKNKKVTFVRTPKFEEVPYPVIMEPNLVIEYYSR